MKPKIIYLYSELCLIKKREEEGTDDEDKYQRFLFFCVIDRLVYGCHSISCQNKATICGARTTPTPTPYIKILCTNSCIKMYFNLMSCGVVFYRRIKILRFSYNGW